VDQAAERLDTGVGVVVGDEVAQRGVLAVNNTNAGVASIVTQGPAAGGSGDV
jgi:hypothetical protein